ncbi:GntR family transcriptional regulator [Burkholderia ubonensis]|uniref:GntR family transcriptional regulator n=1 Tax=Burkholderia ubonensis TaxID=101571 RepID=A0A117X9W8_9BURK|nr:FadR/GntR family transcriptional regulator [Burkholderia ubonensis]KUZ63888.1 GntR family transcriptional regulator [Burkholderia ubonensis]KUZ76144.1 GntR family transcriptional regulator [Burkholderia ubonensis]KUZ81356.1 GntR family transcriptional regulator [Burkholderia ubonensis]KVA00410.1 GntR family transcriptional regulator [Burkholderia ubonensis]KVA13818.1 GntR family transcriptional regulator [Burkholderia ubonensis]
MSSARTEILENGFRPLQIYEQVAEKIRDEIRAGRYAPDTRLPSERELAALFQVGRPAVREALGALQNEGLVFTKRNSGTYVVSAPLDVLARRGDQHAAAEADFSPTSTLDVRLILEPAIARLAAAHRKPDPAAERYLAQMETITDINDPQQRALWNESDRLFHRQLALMTGDALIVKIAGEVAKTMDQPLWKRLKDDGIYDAGRIRLYVSEHRLIYEAIVAGDADAAAFYVEQHILRVRRDIAPK